VCTGHTSHRARDVSQKARHPGRRTKPRHHQQLATIYVRHMKSAIAAIRSAALHYCSGLCTGNIGLGSQRRLMRSDEGAPATADVATNGGLWAEVSIPLA
jgi:hypothetical protein